MKRCYGMISHMARPRVYSDDLRDKLLDAAVEVVADRGVGALSVREVAHLAGTSATAVYSLLGSKTALTAGCWCGPSNPLPRAPGGSGRQLGSCRCAGGSGVRTTSAGHWRIRGCMS